jgi:ubiquinone/menaquinone biosynthesis C-methylase UbiE
MSSRLREHLATVLQDRSASLQGKAGSPRALDVACGDGSFTQLLHETLGHYELLVGLDIDASLLEEAEDRFADAYPSREQSLRFVSADARAIPFMTASFDIVAVSNALHHVANVAETLDEIVRVAKPGGLLLIHEMVSDRLSPPQEVARDLHHFKARIDRAYGVSHRPTYSYSELEELLRRASLRGVPLRKLRSAAYEPEAGAMDTDADGLVEDRVEFVETYAELAQELPMYPQIRKEAARLTHRLRSIGFTYPTQHLFALQKADSSELPSTGGSTGGPE